jgi:HK97 family phage major capsid protein
MIDQEMLDTIQRELSTISKAIEEKFNKFGETSSEVKELQAKMQEIAKEFTERKHQFEVEQLKTGSFTKERKSYLDTKADELALAHALCVDHKTGTFKQAAWERVKSLPEFAEVIKAFGDVDAMTTSGSGTGADWIPTAFSTTLYEEIWLQLEIARLFRRIPMPAPTYVLPFSPGRIIPLAGTEGGTVAKKKPTTDKITLTAKKIMAIVEMTDEFEADSLVPALNFLRQQLIDAFALAQETMALNGEDTGNHIYASGQEPGATDVRSLVNGIRKDAMAKGASVDFGAASGFTADNLRALRTKMGKYGKKPSDLAYIVSIADYNKMLGFTGYQALYQYARPVTTYGELGNIDGIPILVSELIPGASTDASDAPGLLNASGLWDNSVKTKTTCVLVNRNGYLWGDRKEFELELWRNPMNQTTNLIGSQRLDFAAVGSDTSKFCSVGYNY